jgi:hypothetical protein
MRWHPDLHLEIAAEFRALDGGSPWARIEEWFHVRKFYKLRHWASYAQWWKKTTAGKRFNREWMRRKRALLRSVVVGLSKCTVCGREYERRATAKQTRRTCSRSCATTLRNAGTSHFVTIDGRTKSLTQWALEHGIGQTTLHYRLKRGMNIRDALTAPLHQGRSKAGRARQSTELRP